MGPRIAVIGSINRDLTVSAQSIPRPGETVIGSGHFSGPGGKGANQAIAAARLGARVSMVGRVGDDAAGEALLETLKEEGVNTAAVGIAPGLSTGVALITLDGAGENAIVVSPGANTALTPEVVDEAADIWRSADICLLQLEIPLATVAHVVRSAAGMVVLNPAPALLEARPILKEADLVVPNRSELALLAAASEPGEVEQVLTLVSRFEDVERMVVTLGAHGALVVDSGNHELVAPPDVEVVDTTGCGDAFCAALAVALGEGRDLVEATRWATAAGASAATRRGAGASMPTRAEVGSLFRG